MDFTLRPCRDGIYYILSITITIIMPSSTITCRIFKIITIAIILPYANFYKFVLVRKQTKACHFIKSPVRANISHKNRFKIYLEPNKIKT